MTKDQRLLRLFPWFSLLGFFGFLGLLPKFNGHPNYFFFIFFGFFAFFFYYHLEKDGVDERLLENRKRAVAVMLSFFTLLSFTLLFLLDRQVPADTVLLVGSLGYAAGFVLAPALTLFFDRKAD